MNQAGRDGTTLVVSNGRSTQSIGRSDLAGGVLGQDLLHVAFLARVAHQAGAVGSSQGVRYLGVDCTLCSLLSLDEFVLGIS